MHSTYSCHRVVKVFGEPEDAPKTFRLTDDQFENLRRMRDLRLFLDHIRIQSGHRVAALVWDVFCQSLPVAASLVLQPSETLRFEITPDKHLAEIEQRNRWLAILDKRIIRQ
ncbi:MAG TPA: hypothetical protein VF438_03935 [Candidatus Paceibacterota bacterium]